MGSGCEVLFLLNCPAGPASLRENCGFAMHEVNFIEKALNELVGSLCQSWENIHGNA